MKGKHSIEEDLNNPEDKRICHNCIKEKYLSEEIKRNGKRQKCSYCKKISKCYLLNDFADRIDSAISVHYIRSSDQATGYQLALLADKESDYVWLRDGEPVINAIMDAAAIPEQAAQDTQIILEEKHFDMDAAAMGEETEFSSETYYEERRHSDELWQKNWQSFERTLKSEARYFSLSGLEYLKLIFDDVDKMKAWDNKPLIIEAGPNSKLTSLYRARVFQSDEKLKTALIRPDRELGSPPSTSAIAGRMNALGISVFYGANNPKVALSEVRPPVGSQVAIARFEILRPIILLDLTALKKVTIEGSIFDKKYSKLLEKSMFLRNLSQRITAPVLPDDEQFEYLATQAIADFLASESKVSFDGIIFPSAQIEGKYVNVVLFHKAARVEELSFLDGTNIEVCLQEQNEDGWTQRYTVREEVPQFEKNKLYKYQLDEDLFSRKPSSLEDLDKRIPTLKIDLHSINVHKINSVEYKTKKHLVERYRYEKINLGDSSFDKRVSW